MLHIRALKYKACESAERGFKVGEGNEKIVRKVKNGTSTGCKILKKGCHTIITDIRCKLLKKGYRTRFASGFC